MMWSKTQQVGGEAMAASDHQPSSTTTLLTDGTITHTHHQHGETQHVARPGEADTQAPYSNTQTPPSTINHGTNNITPYTPPTDVISIFVVTFDSKEGNVLEWYMPQELALEGIEFRALISGAHTITSDFIFFRQGDYYGVACYEKLTIISDVERGARMKSIGVIVSNYYAIHQHLEYLAQQVRNMVVKPGDYSGLEEYYLSRKASIPSSWDTPQKVTHQLLPPTVIHNLTPVLGEGIFHLVKFFGEQLIILWKATLLCKRILLFSPPPIGPVCGRVHSISLLSAHSTPGLPTQLLRPLFYISIADMDLLQEQHSYVACTTEKIFEEKTGVCDIYVENQSVRIPVMKDKDIGAIGLNPRQDKAFVRELAMTHGFDLTYQSIVLYHMKKIKCKRLPITTKQQEPRNNGHDPIEANMHHFLRQGHYQGFIPLYTGNIE
ncbi:DENN domain-containing protein 11-like [Homarus americanus]|uniref:DENN domain-containing protein 11-like n=1 Tax=Homarus americanus TaxID=6706 RepID=A0A8J5MQH5_HOMAM|nr:DENN domain-containing protein 11-like [Homarus americanus]